VLDVAPLPAAAWHQPLAPIRGDKATKQRFATYAIGYFHIDLTEVSTEQGKLCLFPAIDRTSKFAFVRLVESAGKMEAPDVLRDLIEAVPYRIHTADRQRRAVHRAQAGHLGQVAYLRPGLRRARHQAQADRGEPPLKPTDR
jgi:hypothetical protein